MARFYRPLAMAVLARALVEVHGLPTFEVVTRCTCRPSSLRASVLALATWAWEPPHSEELVVRHAWCSDNACNSQAHRRPGAEACLWLAEVEEVLLSGHQSKLYSWVENALVVAVEQLSVQVAGQ